MQRVTVQEIFVEIQQKAVFFELYIANAEHLPWFHKRHRAEVVIIGRFAVHHYTGLHFFESDHVKVAGVLGSLVRAAASVALNKADQWILRWRITIHLVQLAQGFNVLHLVDLK